MFRREQSTLPELGDVEHISITLPAISEVEQRHLVISSVFWMKFDLCNTPVRSCLCTCIFLHVYECEHNFYTGFKDWCTCIDRFLVCSNLSFFLVPTSINDMYLKIEFG